MRVRTEYGLSSVPDQLIPERAANAAANRLSKPYRQYDEAGLLVFENYDFKGNLLEKTRRVVSDESILTSFAVPPPDWKITAFRVDWNLRLAPPLRITPRAY